MGDWIIFDEVDNMSERPLRRPDTPAWRGKVEEIYFTESDLFPDWLAGQKEGAPKSPGEGGG